jgi:alkaline phosphatase D
MHLINARSESERILGRRGVLALAGLAGLGLAAAGFSPCKAWANPRARVYPFTMGVASGDPLPYGVVLWTRLAPKPLALDGKGGMPARTVEVGWEVAADERFRTVVRRGKVYAVPELGHSVHVEVNGLRPGREYFYRFRAMGTTSRVGRTKTAPAPGTALRQLRFAVASCQAWWEGFYTAYARMAAEDLDLIVHLGDYIYENPIPRGALYRRANLPIELRREPWTLGEYRNRYALFRPSGLRDAHASAPFVLTWDDHELENNWAGDISAADGDPDQDPAVFRAGGHEQPRRTTRTYRCDYRSGREAHRSSSTGG